MLNLAIVIVIALSTASAMIGYQLYQKTTPERLKNKQRIIVWWFILVGCLAVFHAGVTAIALLLMVLLMLATYELCAMLAVSLTITLSVLASAIMAPLFYCSAVRPEQSSAIFILALLGALTAYCLPQKPKALALTLWLSAGFSLSSVLLIATLAEASSNGAAHTLLFLFFVTAVNDVAQYTVGSALGKTPITPRLSPNKTAEGLLGGILVTGACSALFLPKVLNVSWLWALAIGVALSVAGFLGDVNISKLKRAVHVKDSGVLLPGHGGLLDRIDSLLTVAPVFGLIMIMF
jgi:phosphatidate cytidylyltransferase